MRKFNRFNNYITRIIIMSAAGCLLIFCAGRYQPAFLNSPLGSGQGDIKHIKELSSGKSAYFVSNVTDTWEDYLNGLSKKIENRDMKKRRENPEVEYIPSVLQFNLAALYPDNKENDNAAAKHDVIGDAASSILSTPAELAELFLKPLYQKLNLPVKNKSRDSHGGQMYDYLNRKDAEWTSNLYQWIQATPSGAAAMKSLSKEVVTGTYNPNDPIHKPEDPDTWLIPTWKNVTVDFYDGDGKQTELYSNTREILSMASVNTYYTDWQNTEQFKHYAGSLWDASHSYSTKISAVYYCDGCETPPVLDADAVEESADAVLGLDAINTPKTVLETAGDGTGPGTDSAAAGNETLSGSTAEASVNLNAGESIASLGTGSAPVNETLPSVDATGNGAVSGSGVSVGNGVISESGGSLGAGTVGENSSSVTVNPASQPTVQTEAAQEVKNIQSVEAAEPISQNIAEVSVINNASGSTGQTPTNGAADASSGAPSNSMPVLDSSGTDTAATNSSQASVAPSQAVVAPVAAPAVAAVAQQTDAKVILNDSGMFCSGHVDLIITARITGLSEKKNLFSLDKVAPRPWTPYMKSYVWELNSKDWSDEYGLSAMELGIGKPLTSSEIGDYMNTLPIGTSPERKAVVAYALNSVGKIPYYYGGKPAASGYENNRFSTPTGPDHKGRVLSGLDCSGWVNWVYWSSIGTRLNALGTSGLIYEGRPIRREDLKPGDILVKQGLDAHVVLFLSWASDDTMVCIHETGGKVSNVTVSTMGTDWPYYRAILD